MPLIERHMLARMALVLIVCCVAVVNVVIFASLIEILVPVARGLVPASILVDAYRGVTPLALYLVLPLVTALAVAASYARWWSTGTIPVLHAAGISTWQVARPGILLILAAASAGACIAHFWAPAGARALEQAKHDAMHNFVPAAIESNRFNQVGSPATVLYVRDWQTRTVARDVFLHNGRDPDLTEVVVARRAIFASRDDGISIVFQQGSIQRFRKGATVAEAVDFDRFATWIDRPPVPARTGRPPYEFPTSELLHLPPSAHQDLRLVRDARAELHKRILTLILALAWGLLALALSLRMPEGRHSGLRVCAGAVVALTAAHVVFVILFDTVLRYFSGLVPVAYALVALVVLAALEAMYRSAAGGNASPPSRHLARTVTVLRRPFRGHARLLAPQSGLPKMR